MTIGETYQLVFKIENIYNFLSDVEKFEKKMSNCYTESHKEAVKNLFNMLKTRSANVLELTNDLKLEVGLLSKKEDEIKKLTGRHKRIFSFLETLRNGRKLMKGTMGKRIIESEVNDERKRTELLHGVNERTRYLSENVRQVFKEMAELEDK